jgi:hypothetical protein
MKIDHAIGEMNELYWDNAEQAVLSSEALAGTNWVNERGDHRYFKTTLATGQVLRAHFRLFPKFLPGDQAMVSFDLDDNPFPWESETSKINGQTVRQEIEVLVTTLAPLAREIMAQEKARRAAVYAEIDAQAKQAEIDRQTALLRADQRDPKN